MGFNRWPLPSQPLKREQVGGRSRLLLFGLLRALWLLLFFSLSVLGPGGSQDPRCFCLRAGPLLFIRRQSTSSRSLESSLLSLDGEGQWWASSQPSDGREHRQRAVKPQAAATPTPPLLQPVALGGQGGPPHGAGGEPASHWGLHRAGTGELALGSVLGNKNVYAGDRAQGAYN